MGLSQRKGIHKEICSSFKKGCNYSSIEMGSFGGNVGHKRKNYFIQGHLLGGDDLSSPQCVIQKQLLFLL